jgi:predicted nucleic-acid-binding protein
LGRLKIAADTSVLVRGITGDDERQSKLAQAELAKADGIALTLPALCELVWVLSQAYKVRTADIAEAIRRLMNGANVLVNRPAVEAGLAMLDAGGDFAEGVISYEMKEAGSVQRLSCRSTKKPRRYWQLKAGPFACSHKRGARRGAPGKREGSANPALELLALRPDERPDLWVGLVVPPTAMKYPIMADFELKVVGLFRRGDPTAELVRRDGLARRANIVPLALNRHQGGALDGGRFDPISPHPEAASR